MSHAHCLLDTKGYKHTITHIIIHCFSTAITVTQTPLPIMIYVDCLSCLAMSACSLDLILSSVSSNYLPPPHSDLQWEKWSMVHTGSCTHIFNGYRRLSFGVKQYGREVDHPSPFSVEVIERVELQA